MSYMDIYNFLPLSAQLLTSGMPTPEQLKSVSEAGVEVVINLALPTSEGAVPNETQLVDSLGMSYVGIPVNWDHPTRESLVEFMDTMDAHRESRILVHCQANFRATAFVTLYRILRLGWTREQAFPDMNRIWNPKQHPIWDRFIEENLSDPR